MLTKAILIKNRFEAYHAQCEHLHTFSRLCLTKNVVDFLNQKLALWCTETIVLINMHLFFVYFYFVSRLFSFLSDSKKYFNFEESVRQNKNSYGRQRNM